MLKRISAVKARQNLGQMMNEVAIRGDDYIIERAGKALVAIIPIEKYQRLQKKKDKVFQTVDEIRSQVKDEDSSIIEKEIAEAVKAYKKSTKTAINDD